MVGFWSESTVFFAKKEAKINKRKGSEIIEYLEDLVYEEKQLQEDGVYLTLKRVLTFLKRGDIDFGGGEYRESEIRGISPERISTEDKYGWWSLREGEYLIEFNEKIKESIPQEDVIILQPALRLIRNGAYHPTIIIGEPGSITTILYVGKRGLSIKENARISKLIIIKS